MKIFLSTSAHLKEGATYLLNFEKSKIVDGKNHHLSETVHCWSDWQSFFSQSHKLVIWDPSLKTMITIFYESILFSGLVKFVFAALHFKKQLRFQMSFSCPILPCYSLKRINIYGPFRKKYFQMLHSALLQRSKKVQKDREITFNIWIFKKVQLDETTYSLSTLF